MSKNSAIDDWNTFFQPSNDDIVDAFYQATLSLIDNIENHGWKKFSSNYLREHVRCRTGAKFSNTRSPDILRALLAEHPELSKWIKLGPLQD